MSYGHLAVDYHERIRRRIGSQNCEPHAKHFLDSTQTQFFAKFIGMYPQI